MAACVVSLGMSGISNDAPDGDQNNALKYLSTRPLPPRMRGVCLRPLTNGVVGALTSYQQHQEKSATDLMANMLLLLSKLTAQDCNDLVFALKLFRHEKYKGLRYDASIVQLAFVDSDDALVALRLWGPAALADKLDRLARRLSAGRQNQMT
jgi:hypothetical protein